MLKLLSRFNTVFSFKDNALKRNDNEYPYDFDEEVISIAEKVKPYTMTSPDRVFALKQAVEYVIANHIPGCFVECGVWRGGSMMAVALTLLANDIQDRDLYLFDTFDGMCTPSDLDRDFRGKSAAELMEHADRDSSWIWAVSPKDEVLANILSTGYPKERIHLVEGRVEKTIPDNAPIDIALLRLDTDWYESTAHEMEHLFPRLTEKGVIIIDDYGHWQGARRAVDEYISREQIPLLLNRIDYTGRIAVKTND